jgi:hypothetical protein
MHKPRFHFAWIFLISIVFLISCSQAASLTPGGLQDEQAVATPTPAARLADTPTVTPGSTMTLYQNADMALSFEYPAGWQLLDGEPGYERFDGEDGFFRLGAIASGGMSLDALARSETEHTLQPFGANPVVEEVQVAGREARKITPSADQPKTEPGEPAWGEVVVELPMPALVGGFLADYVLFQADLVHLDQIAATMKFDEQPLKQSPYPAESDTPAAGICADYEQPVVNVVISAEMMPDPRCIKVTPRQVLNLVNKAGVEVPLKLGFYELLLQPGEELLLNVPVGKYLAPGVHQLELGVAGSAPEIWLVPAPEATLPEQPALQESVIQGVPVFSMVYW